MEVSGHTADELYHELWWKMRVSGKEGDSRNGPVISIESPVLITLYDPTQRVLFNATRDCNPFFHIAEVVWMFAGSNDVRFVEKFNKRYREYADKDTNRVHGAYGTRWLEHFDVDQIDGVIKRLDRDYGDRQAVIAMWNPTWDLPMEPPHNDRPCNTHIYFRVVNHKLNMLVCNRSNDLVWGAMGANLVHFTYLQELIATSIGLRMGDYQVLTNNLHVYPGMPRYEEISTFTSHEWTADSDSYPLLDASEFWGDLYWDCVNYVRATLGQFIGETPRFTYRTKWMNNVAIPMMETYLLGSMNHRHRREMVEEVQDGMWRTAATEWLERRN